MGTFLWIALIAAATLVVAGWIRGKRRSLAGRAVNFGRAMVGEASEAIADAAPVTQLEQVIRDAEDELVEENKRLAAANAQVNGLNRQIDPKTNEIASLEANVAARMRRVEELQTKLAAAATDAERDDISRQIEQINAGMVAKAQEIAALQREVGALQDTRDRAKANLERSAALVRQANQRVEEAKRKAKTMRIELNTAKVDLALQQSRSAIGAEDSALGSLGDALERAQQAIDRTTSLADAGRTADTPVDDFDTEFEQRQVSTEAQAVLDRLRAKSATT